MFDSFTFIELDVVQGFFHYDCMTKVIEMNYNTEGFLLISDDVLVKYWNLDNHDIRKIWFIKDMLHLNTYDSIARSIPFGS